MDREDLNTEERKAAMSELGLETIDLALSVKSRDK